MMVARRTPGPAYANLQWRKPRDVGRGGASDAMGISALAVCCRGAMTACLGSGQWSGELGRPIAMGRTGAARRRLIDESVAPGVATASMVMAGRESARQRRNGMPRRTGSGHDVCVDDHGGGCRGTGARRAAALKRLDDDHTAAATWARVRERLGAR
jgi:hypothetical protein